MNEISCSHCGQVMPDSYTRCPVCGNDVDKQAKLVRSKPQQRFVVWFVVLTIFCLVVALWLPR
jgi:predicted amidophosphoribosyltransferase